MAAAALPTVFINHGGGPCFFMPDDGSGPFPANTWRKMASNLSQLAKLPGPNAPKVKAILVASAHWETEAPAVTVAANPPLLYDYYGFPPETYEIEWPAPGDPDLAQRVKRLLTGAGFPNVLEEASRGFDHGVFIPLKLAFPAADVPVVQLSLVQGLDPKTHLAMGKALAPLRREGVLIIGSGLSFHNMSAFFGADEKSVAAAESFDAWLDATCGEDGDASAREPRLERWATDAPNARVCHPREEHLASLFIAAGAASGERGRKTYADKIGGLAVSGYAFGDVDDERLLVSRAS
jgi:aromatic ring-opening dioxygenase catalytic subunit (LigB family)